MRYRFLYSATAWSNVFDCLSTFFSCSFSAFLINVHIGCEDVLSACASPFSVPCFGGLGSSLSVVFSGWTGVVTGACGIGAGGTLTCATDDGARMYKTDKPASATTQKNTKSCRERILRLTLEAIVFSGGIGESS